MDSLADQIKRSVQHPRQNRAGKDVINILKTFGIKVIIVKNNKNYKGAYGNREIELTPTINLGGILHEIGHAIDDLIKPLNVSKQKTGEMTAFMYQYMMLYNESIPDEVLEDAQNLYKKNSLNYKGKPLSVAEAAKRVLNIFNHSISVKIRNVMYAFFNLGYA